MGKPVIAAINSAAAGGGMIPALCADVRLASDAAFFTTAFAQRGVIAENAMAWLLPRLVGPSRALEMMMSRRRVDAREALDIGLVNQVFPQQCFRTEVQAYAARIATRVSPRSLAVIKRQVWKGVSQTYAESLATADEEIVKAAESRDFVEGVAHLIEKREPDFPDLDTAP